MGKLIFILLLISTVCLGQSQRISDMPNAGTIGGTELIPVVQDAANRKATPLQLSTYVNSLYGAGVSTFLTTPSWTNFNSMITGTAPYWPLTGSAAGSGSVLISGFTDLTLIGSGTFANNDGFDYFNTVDLRAVTNVFLSTSSGGDFIEIDENGTDITGSLEVTEFGIELPRVPVILDTAAYVLVREFSSGEVKRRSASSIASSGAFWPLTGTGTLTGDVTIAGDLNVGIGASPAFKLDVAGTVDNDNIFRLRDNNLSTIMNVFEQTGETTINIQPTNLNMVGSDATLRQIDITNQGAGTMRVDIQAESGDVDVSFNIVGTDWVMGVDNSDSDAFKIATGSALGTNDVVALTTTGVGQAGGLKHQRVTTGSIGASSSAAVTLTWTNAFADANYTVNVSIVQADTDDQTLIVDHIESISATQVVVRVVNEDAVSAKTGTLHLIAMHD